MGLASNAAWLSTTVMVFKDRFSAEMDKNGVSMICQALAACRRSRRNRAHLRVHDWPVVRLWSTNLSRRSQSLPDRQFYPRQKEHHRDLSTSEPNSRRLSPARFQSGSWFCVRLVAALLSAPCASANSHFNYGLSTTYEARLERAVDGEKPVSLKVTWMFASQVKRDQSPVGFRISMWTFIVLPSVDVATFVERNPEAWIDIIVPIIDHEMLG
ncbi:hypothetical protein C8J56DRAFT_586647 [Mycena floridula]|nr:hypothetical protein C8J56DRAFT_586647 [Mycena floridula]